MLFIFVFSRHHTPKMLQLMNRVLLEKMKPRDEFKIRATAGPLVLQGNVVITDTIMTKM